MARDHPRAGGKVNLDKRPGGRDFRAMSHWPLKPEDITRPAYRSLAQGVAAAIDAGSLRPGDRLPPHRDLAFRLGLSVQTVSRAYEELIRADLIAGEVGRGTFVRMTRRESMAVPWVREASAQMPIDLSMLTPVIGDPVLAEAWAAVLAELAHSLPDNAVSSFRPRQTMALYGGMAAGWLARCGLVVPAQRILLTNGATPGLSVALAAGMVAGDEMAAEPLTHHMLGPTARMFGVKLRPVAVDDEGMLPDALDAAARKGRLRALFLTPSGIGPRAAVMGRDRRAALAQVIRAHDLQLIESDMTGPVAPRRASPICAALPERGWYMTTLTKCLSPGLRLGFLALPEPAVEQALNRNLALSWMATPLMAEIALRWISDGTADRLLGFQRTELVARNALVERALPGRTLGFRHGLHRWLPLPEGSDEAALAQQALQAGVAVTPGSRFAVKAAMAGPALRLCLGAAPQPQLAEALRVLSEILPR